MLIEQLHRNGIKGDHIATLVNGTRALLEGAETSACSRTESLLATEDLLREYEAMRPLSFEFLDVLRYVVYSHTFACPAFGEWAMFDELAKRLDPATTPFACHVAFVRYLVNTMGNEGALIDFCNTPNLFKYLTAISQSRTRSLRKTLAAFLLNTSVMCRMASFNEFCTGLMVRMLETEMDPAIAHPLLLALGTMILKDERSRIHAIKTGALLILEKKLQSMPSLTGLIGIITNSLPFFDI
jgi:hypothetical protein